MEKEITERIIKACFDVHNTLGPGFLEKIYHNALKIELKKQGLMFETEKEIKIIYNDIEVGVHRLDLLVEDKIVVELKAVEELSNKYYAQVRSYLHALNLDIGLLVNFSQSKVDFRRVQRNFRGRE